MGTTRKKLQGHLLNWKAIAASLVLLILSLGLLWVSSSFSKNNPIWFGNVLPAFASVIATSGIFALIYEIFIRKQQTDFVLESIELKESIIEAGLVNLESNYLDFDFSKAIKEARTIRLFVLYAHVWLNRFSIEIKDHLNSDNSSLVLCVPSFDNDFIKPLSMQFGYTEDEIKQKIGESISIFVIPSIRKGLGDKTTVKVYMHNARPSYSMYQFDNKVLIGSYYCSDARRRAPMFIFKEKPGSLYEEFNADISQVIEENSVVAYDSEQDTNRLGELLGEFMPAALKELLDKENPTI
jgi:hypothetical protein